MKITLKHKYDSSIFLIEHVDIIINHLRERLIPRMEFVANIIDNKPQESEILKAVYEHEFHILESIISDLNRATEVIWESYRINKLDFEPYKYMNCESCKYRKEQP